MKNIVLRLCHVLCLVKAFPSQINVKVGPPRNLSHDTNFHSRQQTNPVLGFRNNHELHLPSHCFSPVRLSKISRLNLSRSSIISVNDSWGNIAILASIASVSHRIGKATRIGRLLGAPVTAMATAFLLGSIGVLPGGGSPGAKIIQGLSIQLATPLLLLGVNIRECKKRSGPLLLSFLVASISTIFASAVAFPLCSGPLYNALGQDGLKIAAALMAKNVGGGVNYVAVCKALEVSPASVAAGLCVDNIFALLYFPVSNALAANRPDVGDCDNLSLSNEDEEPRTIDAEKISATLTVAFLVTWLGERIGGQSGALPLATIFTVIFTVLFPKVSKLISGSGEELGTSLLYIFFATAGAPGLSIADSARASFVPISTFLALLYSIHGGVLFLALKIASSRGKSLRKSSPWLPQRLLVASSAAIGGPATAAALAKSNNWESLVAPSLIVGNLG